MPSVEQVIREAAERHGVDPALALAIARVESGLQPGVHNTGTAENPEDSWGLFQLNRRGGLGSGYSVEQLVDPWLNADIALSHLAATARAQPDLVNKPGELAQASQRSGDPDYAGKIEALMGGGMAGGDVGGDAGGDKTKPKVNPILDAVLQHQKELQGEVTRLRAKQGELGPDGQPTGDAYLAGKQLPRLEALLNSANLAVQTVARGQQMVIRHQPGVGTIGVDALTGAVTVLSSEAADISAAAQRTAAQAAAGLYPAQAEHAKAQAEEARARVADLLAQAEQRKLAADLAKRAYDDIQDAFSKGDMEAVKRVSLQYAGMNKPEDIVRYFQAEAERQLRERIQQETERHNLAEEEVRRSTEQRGIATLATELGSNRAGSDIFYNRTPEERAAAMPPGEPGESVGMRILRQMGIVPGQSGMLQPKPPEQIAEDLGPSGRPGFAQNYNVGPGGFRAPVGGPYEIQQPGWQAPGGGS